MESLENYFYKYMSDLLRFINIINQERLVLSTNEVSLRAASLLYF